MLRIEVSQGRDSFCCKQQDAKLSCRRPTMVEPHTKRKKRETRSVLLSDCCVTPLTGQFRARAPACLWLPRRKRGSAPRQTMKVSACHTDSLALPLQLNGKMSSLSLKGTRPPALSLTPPSSLPLCLLLWVLLPWTLRVLPPFHTSKVPSRRIHSRCLALRSLLVLLF